MPRDINVSHEWIFDPMVNSTSESEQQGRDGNESPALPYSTSTLCSVCRDMIDGKHEVGDKFRLNQTFDELVLDASNCHLCFARTKLLSAEDFGLIRESIERGEAIDLSVQLAANMFFFEYASNRNAKVFVRNPLDLFFARPDHHFPIHPNQGPSSVSNNTISTWTTARSWLSTCLSSHKDCQRSSSLGFLPTRLIDLGSEDYIITPHLCESANLPPSARYMTLSHCWGGQKSLQLTRDSIELFKQHLAVAQLSPTFRHAMEATRRLGVRYLWIDSLCIIQDDVGGTDWSREADRMGDIYEYSVCNLAATRAADGSVGLFTSRNPFETQACTILYPPVKSMAHPSWSELKFALDKHIWERNVDKAPLVERAWVYQEVLLASRILHFCEKQLFWDCNELRACELYPKGVPDFQPNAFRETFKKLSGSSESPDRPPWSQIVNTYTKGILTFPAKDRLAALGGLARRYGSTENYCAGLWKDKLPMQLMWRPHNNARQTVDEYQAPSWSWASINGEIVLRFDDNNPGTELTQVLAINITPAGQSTTGRVSPGSHLRIQGPLMRDHVVHETNPAGTVLKAQKAGVELSWDTHPGGEGDEVFLLAITINTPRNGIRDHLVDGLVGLVLTRAGSGSGQYARRGFFHGDAGRASDGFQHASHGLSDGDGDYETRGRDLHTSYSVVARLPPNPLASAAVAGGRRLRLPPRTLRREPPLEPVKLTLPTYVVTLV